MYGCLRRIYCVRDKTSWKPVLLHIFISQFLYNIFFTSYMIYVYRLIDTLIQYCVGCNVIRLSILNYFNKGNPFMSLCDDLLFLVIKWLNY